MKRQLRPREELDWSLPSRKELRRHIVRLMLTPTVGPVWLQFYNVRHRVAIKNGN